MARRPVVGGPRRRSGAAPPRRLGGGGEGAGVVPDALGAEDGDHGVMAQRGAVDVVQGGVPVVGVAQRFDAVAAHEDLFVLGAEPDQQDRGPGERPVVALGAARVRRHRDHPVRARLRVGALDDGALDPEVRPTAAA